jgi:cysteine desulfurase
MHPFDTPMTHSIYLDYAATTPVDPRVAEKMMRFLTPDGVFGNPASSSHGFGRLARTAVDDARGQVAEHIGAHPVELIWTSGATESDNLAIKGVARQCHQVARHIVTCSSEHKAVLDSCGALEREGVEVSYLDPLPNGTLDLGALESVLRSDTLLVSIMQVNNETGVVQDLESIGRLTRERGILFHVDAAQSPGKVPIDVDHCHIDLMSLCAHKVYGPKGIGALYIRQDSKIGLEALIHGGGQERGLRAGTLATHQIAGMGEAFAIAQREGDAEAGRIRRLREKLWDGIQDLGVHLNGGSEAAVPGILNVSFEGISGEDLLLGLNGIALSSGSACNSANQQPSHALRAMGCSDDRADSAIRFSLGRFTTDQEIEETVAAVIKAAKGLRPWISR